MISRIENAVQHVQQFQQFYNYLIINKITVGKRWKALENCWNVLERVGDTIPLPTLLEGQRSDTQLCGTVGRVGREIHIPEFFFTKKYFAKVHLNAKNED